jgi:hypothetical protein
MPEQTSPPTKPTERPEPADSTRRRGLLVAAGAATLFVAIIGFFALRGSPAPADASGDAVAEDAIPDITDLRGSARGMRIERVDEDDPDRLAALITAESFEPVDVNERLVEKPRAWVYLRDGRTVLIEAQRGRFFMPAANAAPESGQLQGDVRVRFFEQVPAGIDPEQSEPIVTATFDEPVQFDLPNARLSTTGAFRIATPEIDFRGSYLTAVANRVRNRLELIEVRRGEAITFTPLTDEERARIDASRGVVVTARDAAPAARGGSTTATPSSPPTTTAPAGSAPASAATPVHEPRLDYYRAQFLDGVDVARPGQRLRADALDLWLRLVNNELPEGAIRALRFEQAEADGPTEGGTNASTIADATPTRDEGAARPVLLPPGTIIDGWEVAGDPEPVATEPETVDEVAGTSGTNGEPAAPPRESLTLRWTGPLQITPIDAQPTELTRDALALRFTAERSGQVEFRDEQTGAIGKAAAVDYGFTTAALTFSGPGGSVDFRVPDAGTLAASRVTANLADASVHIRGPGELTMAAEDAGDAARRARIRWTEQADVAFAMEDGRATGDLTRASFYGQVYATDGSASLEGDGVDARFVASASGTRRIAQLDVERGKADDGRGGTLAAEQIRVDFEDGTLGSDIDPARVLAVGNVRGQSAGSTIEAGALAATITRTFDGDLSADRVTADGGVRFAGADGTTARAQSLEAEGLSEVVRLAGLDDEPAEVSQNGSFVRGENIVFDGRSRRGRVLGAGEFEQKAEINGFPATTVLARWDGQMTIDDLAGRIECVGNARALSTPDALTKDTLSAERVVIELSPADQSGGEAGRRFARATAYGGTKPDGTPAPATVESRGYDEADLDRVRRLFFLEGMQIVADNARQRLTVPGAGRLLIMDRTARDAADAADPNGDNAVLGEIERAGPGLTRFAWAGRMELDRPTGRAELSREVRVRHKPLESANADPTAGLVDLHCERLTADIRERAGGSSTPGSDALVAGEAVRGELIAAEASGAVYFRSGQRELVADRLRYDAVGARAFATAAPNNAVSMFDARTGTPLSARALSWDLARDRIEIERLAPGALPRP